MIIPIILAGGSGTRLWPVSRKLSPKHLLSFFSEEETLFQNTLKRLDGLAGADAPRVICNTEHRFLIAEQARDADVQPGSIIIEPVGRNTAPAVAVAVLRVLEEYGDDAVLLIMPADHRIDDTRLFHEAVAAGESYADSGRLITFGIVPSAPETGFGYIKKGPALSLGSKAVKPESMACELDGFVEKPDPETAEDFVRSGEYVWNSGIFMFKASVMKEELEKFVPEIMKGCEKAVEKGVPDLDFFRLHKEAFEATPSDSIDYAVMERTDKGAVIPLDAGWNDLGSWDAVWRVAKKDSRNNALFGDVLTHDVQNSYLHSTGRLIAAAGLEGYVVVETSDAVFICPVNRAQLTKKVVEKLKSAGREEATSHKKVFRPWGSYESTDMGPEFQVKRLSVKPGAVLSLQKHRHRSEHWVVVEGTAEVTRDDEILTVNVNEYVYIPLGAVHRIKNPGSTPLEIIEVQSGDYLGEDDIVRLEDNYGRVGD